MTQVKRFFYVVAPSGRSLHMMYSNQKSEGNFTSCGKTVTQGWRWMEKRQNKAKKQGNTVERYPLCTRCSGDF